MRGPEFIAGLGATADTVSFHLLSFARHFRPEWVNYENVPESKLTLTILGAVAEFKRAKIIERMMRGKLHRLQGRYDRRPGTV
jgi:hypothetical protein